MSSTHAAVPHAKKRWSVVLAAAVGLGLLWAPPTAVAAPTLSCHSAALIILVGTNGNLAHYPHNEPETGVSSWGQRIDAIGRGWHIGRTVAGPNGVVYLMVGSTGELRRYRWNGTSWEMWNGVAHRIVGSGWSRYTQAEHRNKVTVDERGRLYMLAEDGTLRVRIWQGDDATGAWTPDTASGRVIDTGWDQYDLIVAAGDGVLFARKPNGDLHRYRWHAESNRFTQYGPKVGAGWNIYNRVFSPGGDILYGTRANNGGELMWYRWHESTNTWAYNYGIKVGSGFYSELDVVANANSCQLSGFPAPTRPSVASRLDAPMTPLQGSDGLVSFFYVNSAGGLTVAKQRDPGRFDVLEYQTFAGHHQFTGQPGAGRNADGRFDVLANSSADATYRGRTQPVANGVWGADPVAPHGGWLVSDPVVVSEVDQKLTTYGADTNGRLWRRTQAGVNGQHTTWFRFSDVTGIAEFTVLRNGSASDIVARFADGSVRTSRVTAGAAGAWRTIGAGTTGKPAAVAHPNGDLQVFVRGNDGRVRTQRETGGVFSGVWQEVGDLNAAGSPAAVLRSAGLVELAVRGTDGLVYQSRQLAPAGGFGAWRVEYFEEAATDPAGLVLADGSPIFSWRSPQGVITTVYIPTTGSTYRGTTAR